MEPLAHSSRPQRGIPPQSYADHVCGVTELACTNALEAVKYWHGDADRFVEAIRLAAQFHDLGKLEPANQKVLASAFRAKRLPINHVDAGVARLFEPSINNLLAACAVYSHHKGLPDFQDQRLNGPGKVFRDLNIKSITDQRLHNYLGTHDKAVGMLIHQEDYMSPSRPSPLPSLAYRVALSCLVDADHYDSARHEGKIVSRCGPPLNPDYRLTLLNEYVSGLGEEEHERNVLRREVYQACSNADPRPGFYACDSAVGTGKTTAVMAHLLHAAQAKGLRRIFVVLPFTNIIDQSVKVYRRALVRPNELQADVVAAHHHKAEFEDLESRHLSFLWKAPIVVTTAVQFFETLAANRPGSLRKLHQLPGSAVFIDEAHAALPTHLWPQAWEWLRELESDWGCHFVLGSGSLNRFWQLQEFSERPVDLPELVPAEIKAKLSKYEKRRVTYQSRADLLSEESLLRWLPEIAGPRLLIVNTVQSAAVLAKDIDRRCGRNKVEHLSTSLCPRDRKITLDRVKRRLYALADDDWTLVATSCVEAGVNLSFRNALRERCSLNSLIQVGGRVSREGEYPDSTVWDFELKHGGFLKRHPGFDVPARILGELFDEGRVCAEASTEAMRREVRQQELRDISDVISKAERNLQFPVVSENFTVIDSDTVTAVVDQDLLEKLREHEQVDTSIFQQLSVQIWRYREVEYALTKVAGFRDLYCWKLLYDDFLGYMAGVLEKLRHEDCGTIV